MDQATVNRITRENALNTADMRREAARNDQHFEHSLRMLDMSNSAELAHVKATNDEKYCYHKLMLELDHEYAKKSRTLEVEGRALGCGTPTLSHGQTSTGTQTVNAGRETHAQESKPKIDLLKRPAEDGCSVRMDEKEGAKLQGENKDSKPEERQEDGEVKNEVTVVSNEAVDREESEKAVESQPRDNQKKIYSVDELLKSNTGDILCPPLMFTPQKSIERQAGKSRRGGGDGGRRKIEFGMMAPPDYFKSTVDIEDDRRFAIRARTTTFSDLEGKDEDWTSLLRERMF